MTEEEELSELMERLRRKCGEQRSWMDSVKALRSVVTQEKRHLAETLDRIHIQRCLDTLQSAIKVLTQQSMLARLRCIARQTGLNFSEKPPNNAVLSSDMFYVEACLDTEKVVKDVRIAHQGEATSCPELLRLLSSGEFTLFSKHLEGLSLSYQINGDKKQRTKAFHALQSLETDLNLLAQLQSSINGVGNYIHKSPLGILLPRNGGLPMKLIYFVSPYDLLDKKTKAAHPMTVEAIMEHELGHSVTVCLDSFSNTKLQTIPLMTVNTLQEGKSLPSFSALSNVNSCTLPACFVLRLPKAIPLALSVVKKIYSLTNVDLSQGLESKPLLSLIVEDQSDGAITSVQELFVTLPDQQHRYYLQEGCGLGQQQGVLVSKIHFTHPTHVPQILVHLRQQLLFNALIGSCVRPSAKKEESESMVFEVTALSLQHVCVTFEHPLQEAMATVELDLSDITSVKCRILSAGDKEPFVSEDYGTKVFQRCLSVPVTMRAILMKVLGQLRQQIAEDKLKSKQKEKQRNRNIVPLMIPGPYAMDISQKTGSGHTLQHQNSAPLPHSYQSRNLKEYEHPALLDPSSASPELLDSLKAEKVAKNPMLASLLDQEPGFVETDSPMLSKLLDDQAPTVSSLPASNPAKLKKIKKRKPDPLFGRSPKHRTSEDGLGDRPLELETPSPLDVKLPGPPLSGTSNSSATVIDLTETEPGFIGESHVSKLAHTVNKIIVDSIRSDSVHLTESATSPDVANLVNNIDQKTEWSKEPLTKQSSFSDLWADSVESDGPIDPDLFTNKSTAVPMKVKHSVSRQSSASQQSEMMEFDTELLNADPNFSDSLIDNGSEEMGMEACDASAFGLGVNPVTEMGSKLANSSSSAKLSASKTSSCDGINSKFTSVPSKAGLKRRASENMDTESVNAKVHVKVELESPTENWKKPDSDLLAIRKNSECDVSNTPRRKVENDIVFSRKSDSDSCLYKKSDSDSVNKKLTQDTDTAKKWDIDVPSKKRSDAETGSVSKKKSDSHSSDSSHNLKKKPESDPVFGKKRLGSESPSANKKKADGDSSSSSKERTEGDGVSPSRKKIDSDNCNSAKRKCEVEGSVVPSKKSSEEGNADPGGTSPSRHSGIKMKITTRQYEGRSVSSPLQVLDLSKNSKNNSKSGKDGSLDNNRGGLAMAVTSVAYTSSTLSGSKSPLLNSSISPSKTSALSQSSKSPSSHSMDKNNRSSKMEKSKRTKHSSNSESSKRKREKEEYRREKKKKKLEELHYQPSVREDTIYKSTQVDYPGLNDKKQMPKLKITKSGGKVTVTSSSKASGSILKTVSIPRKSSQPSFSDDDAFAFSGSESLEKEELSRKLSESRLSHTSSAKTSNSLQKSSSSSPKSSHKSAQRSTSKNITVSKADSKLMTKTPTIKLKPIVIPTAGASVTVGAPRGAGSNVQSSPQSAPVSKSCSQSPYTSPSHSSSRSATPTSVTPTTMLSPGSTPSTPPVTNKNGVALSSASSASTTSQNANKIKSPGRLRKGSLSAVIDKLTKSSAITSGPKSDSPEELVSKAKVLAAVVSQQSNQIKSTNSNISNNSVCREHKSPGKPITSGSSDRSGSELEKTKTLYNNVASLLKESSPRKDKLDQSPQRSKSDPSVDKNSTRKPSSASSSLDKDRQKSSGSSASYSSRSGKDDNRKSDSGSSRKNHSSSSASSSGTSPGNQHSSASGNAHGSSGSGSSAKSSCGSGSSDKTGSHRASPVATSGTSSVAMSHDKTNDNSERNSKLHKSSERQHSNKTVTKSTSASSGSSERQSSKENDLGKLKEEKNTLPCANNGKSSVENVPQESKFEKNTEVESWTPASPTEEKEHRSAEETAKIPVLERLQLEYTQESSNSPKSKMSVRTDSVEPDKVRHRASLAGLLEQEERKSRELGDSKPSESEATSHRTNAFKTSKCVKVNGETDVSDPHSANVVENDTVGEPFRTPSPVTQSLDTSRTDPGGLDHFSPKSKKARTSSSSNCNSQPVLSPHSDASSPDNQLVIDVDPSTPKSNCVSASPMPQAKPDPITPQHAHKDRTASPITKVSPGPSPKLHRRSPTPSPVVKIPSNPASVAAPSPVEIDDDLMDDVVLGMGS